MGKKKPQHTQSQAKPKGTTPAIQIPVETTALNNEAASSSSRSISGHSRGSSSTGSISPKADIFSLNDEQIKRFDLIAAQRGLVKANKDTINHTLKQATFEAEFYTQYDIHIHPQNFLNFLANDIKTELIVMYGGGVLNTLAGIAYADVDYMFLIKEINANTLPYIKGVIEKYFHSASQSQQTLHQNKPGFKPIRVDFKFYLNHIKLECGNEFILCRIGASPDSCISAIDIKFVASFKSIGLFDAEKLAIDIKTKEILYLGEYSTEEERKQKTLTTLRNLNHGICALENDSLSTKITHETRLLRAVMRLTQGLTISKENYATLTQQAELKNAREKTSSSQPSAHKPLAKEIEAFLLNHYLDNNIARYEQAVMFFLNLFIILSENTVVQTKEGPQSATLILNEVHAYFLYTFLPKMPTLIFQNSDLNEFIQFFALYQDTTGINRNDCMVDIAALPHALKLLRGMLLLDNICHKNNVPTSSHLKLKISRGESCFLAISDPVEHLLDIFQAWTELNKILTLRKQKFPQHKNWRWEKFVSNMVGTAQEENADLTNGLKEKVALAITLLPDSSREIFIRCFKESGHILLAVINLLSPHAENLIEQLMPQIIDIPDPDFHDKALQHPLLLTKILNFILAQTTPGTQELRWLIEILNSDKKDSIFDAKNCHSFFEKTKCILASKHKDKISVLKTIFFTAANQGKTLYGNIPDMQNHVASAAAEFLNSVDPNIADADIVTIEKFVLRCELESQEETLKLKRLKAIAKNFPSKNKSHLILSALHDHFNHGPQTAREYQILANLILEIGRTDIASFSDIADITAILKTHLQYEIKRINETGEIGTLDIAMLLNNVPAAMATEFSIMLLSSFGLWCATQPTMAMTVLHEVAKHNSQVFHPAAADTRSYPNLMISAIEFMFRNHTVLLQTEAQFKSMLMSLNSLLQEKNDLAAFDTCFKLLSSLAELYPKFFATRDNSVEHFVKQLASIKNEIFWQLLPQYPKIHLGVLRGILSQETLSQLDINRIAQVSSFSRQEIIFDNAICENFFTKISLIIQNHKKNNIDFLNNIFRLVLKKDQEIYQKPKEITRSISDAGIKFLNSLTKNETFAEVTLLEKFTLLLRFYIETPTLDSLNKLCKDFPSKNKNVLIFLILSERLNRDEFCQIDSDIMKEFMISTKGKKYAEIFGDNPDVESTLKAYLSRDMEKSARDPQNTQINIFSVLHLLPKQMGEEICIHTLSGIQELLPKNPHAAAILMDCVLQYDAADLSIEYYRKARYVTLILDMMMLVLEHAPTVSATQNTQTIAAYASLLLTLITKNFLFLIRDNIIKYLTIVINFITKQNNLKNTVFLIQELRINAYIIYQPPQTDRISADALIDVMAPLLTSAIQNYIHEDDIVTQTIGLIQGPSKLTKRNGKLLTHIFTAAKTFRDKVTDKKDIDAYIEFNILISSVHQMRITVSSESFATSWDALDFINAACDLFFGTPTQLYKQSGFLNQLIDAIVTAQKILLSHYQKYTLDQQKQCFYAAENIFKAFDVLIALHNHYAAIPGFKIQTLKTFFPRLPEFAGHFLAAAPTEKVAYQVFLKAYDRIESLDNETRLLFENSILQYMSIDTQKLNDSTLFNDKDTKFTADFIEFINIFVASAASLRVDNHPNTPLRKQKIAKLLVLAKFFTANKEIILGLLQKYDAEHAILKALTHTFFTFNIALNALVAHHEHHESFKLFSVVCDLYDKATPHLPAAYAPDFFKAFEGLFIPKTVGADYIQRCHIGAEHGALLDATIAYLQHLLNKTPDTTTQQTKLLKKIRAITDGIKDNKLLQQSILIYFSKKSVMIGYADDTPINPILSRFYLEAIANIINDMDRTTLNALPAPFIKHIFSGLFYFGAHLPVEFESARRGFRIAFNAFAALESRFENMPVCVTEAFKNIVNNCHTIKSMPTPEFSVPEKITFLNTAAALLIKISNQQLTSFGRQFGLDEKINGLKTMQPAVEMQEIKKIANRK